MFEQKTVCIDRIQGDPLVSVVMNCLDGEAYVSSAIDSILRQSYSNWELIFWDNASTDRTADIVKRYDDPRILYFGSNETVPLGMARNMAIQKASGEFVTFLDSDDQWVPNKLDKQIDWFKRHVDTGFVYSNYHKLIEKDNVTRIGLKGPQPEGDVFAAFLSQYPVNLQTVMVRARELLSLDFMFDPQLELAEEYDLFMRLLHRVRAGYIAEPLAVYRIHEGMSSIRKIERYPQEYESILKRFEKEIPDFKLRYKNELSKAYAKLGYYEARARMAKGERKLAAAALHPHLAMGVQYKVLYCLAIFGPYWWNQTHRFLGRYA